MNNEKVKDFIISWLEKEVEKAGASSLIVGVSGGVDSALVTALCSLSKYPVHAVIMPCQSNESSTSRGHEVADHFGVNKHVIDLSKCFDIIEGQVSKEYKDDDHKKYSEGSLRSRLRTPALGYVAKIFNGLIIGTGNRDEDFLLRYFDKYGDGATDKNLIGDLHKSEVFKLAKYLEVPDSVLVANPSADLWGEEEQTDEDELGISYDMVEWVDNYLEEINRDPTGENMLDLVSRDLSDEKNKALRVVAQHEISTRHKYNPNIPVCMIPKEIK